MTTPDDPRATLVQLVVRLRSTPESGRAVVVGQLLPLLGERSVPLAVRMAAAARAIESLPDVPEAVRDVVGAVTAGLPPSTTLNRLRYLQHLTEKSDALDALVEAREWKVKLDCPRCAARLRRAEMVKHLWHEHGLTLEGAKTRSRAGEVEAIRREFASRGDPALFDRSAAVGGEPALLAWVAETASEEESLPLCRAAAERGAGLCPSCFAELAPAVQELPPPLALAHGRVSGDGHTALARRELRPRAVATLAGAGVMLAFAFFAKFVHGQFLLFAGCFIALAALAYLLTLLASRQRSSPDDDAIDAGWQKLAPRLADRRSAARFLTRLCLTSVGRGDPMERASALNQLIACAGNNPAEQQLLAAALVLQVDDAAQFGRDRAAGVAELVAEALRGAHPADFAQFVLAAYSRVPHAPAERERLRILLLAAAFAAGLTPRDVLDLCAASPPIADAARLPPHHLALLHGIWRHRQSRPWAVAGEARTVFELAESAPAGAGKLLAREPGALLICPTPSEVEVELGPVLVTAGGVSLGGVTVSDPEADVRLEAGGRELVFGRHTFKLGHTIPVEFTEELSEWLRVRAEVLAIYPLMYLRGASRLASQLLAPFVVECPACGTECTPVIGAVAKPLRT